MGDKPVNLDELITGGKPNASGAALGLTEDDLIGGHPVDPAGLKNRLANARAEREKEAAEALAAPGHNIVGEAGPSGPKGPVVDRFGPSASGSGLVADLSVDVAKERRAADEAGGAAFDAALEGKDGPSGGANAPVGRNADQKPGDSAKQAKATAKVAAEAAPHLSDSDSAAGGVAGKSK